MHVSISIEGFNANKTFKNICVTSFRKQNLLVVHVRLIYKSWYNYKPCLHIPATVYGHFPIKIGWSEKLFRNKVHVTRKKSNPCSNSL